MRKHPPVCVQPGHHSPPSNPYRFPPRNTVPAECPKETGRTLAPQRHYREASPLTWSDKQLRERPVSADVIAASTGPPPTVVPSASPADGANTTAGPPCPADHPNRCLPPPVSYHSSSPEKQQSYQVPHVQLTGEESAETSRRPHGRSRDHTRGSETHILSNTDVARIVTWHPEL